jgi:hypothetical protein
MGAPRPRTAYEERRTAHAGIDRTQGFIRKWGVTHAARHDSGPFEDVLDAENIARSVWGDTTFCSTKNERTIRKHTLRSMIHFRKPKGKPLSEHYQRANASRSKVHSAVEHVFAGQKRLHCCRTANGQYRADNSAPLPFAPEFGKVAFNLRLSPPGDRISCV